MNTRNLFSDNYFYAYLVILGWSALPMASATPWSLNLLSGMAILMAVSMIAAVAYSGNSVAGVLKNNQIPIVLLLLAPVWVTIQSISLPVSFIALVSPQTIEAYGGIEVSRLSLSLDQAQTKQMALLSWAYWLFFVVTLLLVDSSKRLRALLLAIVCFGVFQAVFGGYMTLSETEYGFFTRKQSNLGVVTGTFADGRQLAVYLQMCLAAGVGLILSSQPRQRADDWATIARDALDGLLGPKIRFYLLLLVMAAALLLTQSKMGNAAFLISLPFCGLLTAILRQRLPKRTIAVYASLIVFAALVIGNWSTIENLTANLTENLTTQIQPGTLANQTTAQPLRDNSQVIRAYPLAGTGAGTSSTSFLKYPNPAAMPDNSSFSASQNSYLELASTFGLFGFAPLLILVFSSLVSVAVVLARRHNRLARGGAFASGMGIISILIHSTMEPTLQAPANALLFITLLALAPIAAQIPRESD